MAQVSMTVMFVTLNGKPLGAPSGVLSGDQFREAAKIDPSLKLWRTSREHGGDDELIEGPEIATFEDGDLLYTTPRSI